MANKDKFSIEKVELALRESAGLNSVAAQKLKCSPSTIANYLAKSSKLRKAKEESQYGTLDMAEAAIIKQIQEGNTAAIIFYLKTKGKERGYIERQEITGEDGEAIQYVIEAPAIIENQDEWAEKYKPDRE